MTRLVTSELAIAYAKKLHNNKYDYSQVKYKRQKEKVTIICSYHGPWQQRFSSHLQGFGCPKCAQTKTGNLNKKSSKELRLKFIQEAKKVHGNYYDYSKVSYKGKTSKDKVIIIDPVLGEFEQTYGNHITLKHKHPKHYLTVGKKERFDQMYGSVKNRRLDFLKQSRKNHNNEYKYPFLKKEFKGYASSITVICPKCGPIQQIAHNHMRGHGCKTCRRSGYEKRITRWLEKYIDGSHLILNDRKVLKGQELDFYLPKYKIALEFGGVYWHSKLGERSKNYHQDKLLKCDKKGITLLTIFDSDWNQKNKRLIIKARIRAKLGLLTDRLGARECEISEVNTLDSRNFLEKHHIQGYTPSNYNIGLYYKKALVSLLTLGKPRFNKNYEWELLRFCNKRTLVVPGSFSRLFSFFIKNKNPKNIINYSDLRWGWGNVYEIVGFKFIKMTVPSPWYTHVDGKSPLYHRMYFQKHRLKEHFGDNYDPSQTAKYNIENNYYVAVYDCGTAVYEWKRP